MPEEPNETIIDAISGIGSSENADEAYVECELPDGSKHFIVFAPEMATGIASAIMAASAHAQGQRAAQEGAEPAPIPFLVSNYTVSFGMDGDGQPSGMLSAETSWGSSIHLQSDQAVWKDLHGNLAWLLERFDNPPRRN